MLRSVKERVLQALQNARKTTKEVIALQKDDVTRRAESEEWLDSLRNEVHDNVQMNREPPSVIGEFSFNADAVYRN